MSVLDPRGWTAMLRRPEQRRALQVALIAVGALATVLLYVFATRPPSRRVSLVVEQQPALPSPTSFASVASAAVSASDRASAAATAVTASPSPPVAAPTFAPNAALAPAGDAITTRLELTDTGGLPAAVALAVTKAVTNGCAAGTLLLAVRADSVWSVAFDGNAMPAGAPLLPTADGSCPGAPTIAALGDGGFVAAGTQDADGTARLLVLDATGAVRLDLRTTGAGTLAFGGDGATVEIDEPVTATAADGSQRAAGTLARVVGIADDAPAVVRARILPACGRGRLQPGSAAAIAGAASGGVGVVTIVCSSAAQMSASVDAKTVLDILAAQPQLIRDRDYVELAYDDASLTLDPTASGDPALPRLALMTDNSAALRAYDTPAAVSTRTPSTAGDATAASGAGGRSLPAPTSRSAPPAVAPTRTSGGSSSSSRAGAAPGQPAAPAPTRPVATRPALQPPPPPASSGGGAPP